MSRTTSICPNCENQFEQSNSREVYCGSPCKSQADVVRYFRSVRARYGDDLPEDVQYAVQIQLAHMLSGGYPREERRLDAATRAAVKDRDHGRCTMCGAPGEEIDHIANSSSDLSNLRLLCHDCHRHVTEQHLRPIAEDDFEKRARLAETLARVDAVDPIRPCDSANWSSQWSAWVRAHRQPIDA